MGLITAGTVALTNGSKTVTGTGVDWSAVREGWTLSLPDGATLPIARPLDAASLQLVFPYAGATAASSAYAITPTQAVLPTLTTSTQELIRNVADMVTTFRGIRKFFATKATMLADAGPYDDYAVGDVFWANQSPYQVAPPDATDHDETTAGGVKLYASFAGSDAVGGPVAGLPGNGIASIVRVADNIVITLDDAQEITIPVPAGVKVLGYYADEAALDAAGLSPAPGDAYRVGLNLFVRNAAGDGWVDTGPLVPETNAFAGLAEATIDASGNLVFDVVSPGDDRYFPAGANVLLPPGAALPDGWHDTLLTLTDDQANVHRLITTLSPAVTLFADFAAISRS